VEIDFCCGRFGKMRIFHLENEKHGTGKAL
jgi:hypothetical protein